ncbi:MAG: sigma-70 family RNA polymerase sigma factor [Gemmatimonadetes bacterium]|jgi:RNA polymerase sigma-70 factor, ECF subfamily|nr:sigma-70 family RNA polymerase sigma factor [Gemmatimonadota bacterium]MBT6149692.1 sigma-70 family RNA polymerase sigma factor [Gemmatimonadota bacterium]MBT7862076.1 sigma-70 family RNA polymerase sigma factor [Gemmatimonadota bacterium]
MNDEDLVVRLREGDTQAFDVLYNRHSARLLGYLRRMMRDAEHAQDLLQDVFLRLIERRDTIDARRPFTRWLYAVAHNLCCSALRHTRVRQDTQAAVSTELRHQAGQTQARAPDQGLDEERFLGALDEALACLDPQRRSVFLLRHEQGWPIADIGAAIGCPTGTVKSRLFHSTRALAARLGPFDPTPSDTSSDLTGPTQ